MGVLSTLGRVLVSRSTMIVIGVAALCVLVWFGGPLLRVQDSVPLAPATARVAGIAGIVLLFVALEILRRWRVRRLNRKMIADLTSSQSLDGADDGMDDDIEILRQRFEDAMAVLKESPRSGHNLYDLPWYLIVGPSGAGKTTILRNCGLRFPLAERLGVEMIEGVGSTRSCDWWLTDEAVLLDTAGRFITQDVNAAADASTWRGFLDILKTHRPRQPINGVLLVISVAETLVQDTGERRRTVAAVRARLQEIMRGFGIRVPVYVLFTKADLIAGFAEFFEDLADEERGQVWGVTVALDESRVGTKALGALHRGVDRFLRRLSSHVPERLSEERVGESRRLIYAFPEQVAGMCPLLESFLAEVFRPDRYSMQPLLRGMYFTSAIQQGTPIDRMKTAYARAFGFSADRPHPHHGPTRAFFITRLLTDVVMRESGLVGRSRTVERRIFLTWTGVCLVCLLAIAGLGTLWRDGHDRAKADVADFDATLAAVEEGLAAYDAAPTLLNALAPLDALRRSLVPAHQRVRKPFVEELEWLYLFAHDQMRDPLRDAYVRLLRELMLPQIKSLVEERLLRAVRSGSEEQVSELLALYLGLGDVDRFDRDAFERWVALEAEQILPLRPDEREAVDRHVKALLDAWPGAQPLEHRLVASARHALLRVPHVDQIYEVLEAKGNRYPGKSLTDVVGLEDMQILALGLPSPTVPIPYLYTADGFYDILIRDLPALGRNAYREDWMVGKEAKMANERELSTLLEAVASRYTDTYISTWREFLDSIDIRDLHDVDDAHRVLAMLSGTRSPIVRVLEFVADNTDLSVRPGASRPNAQTGGDASGTGDTGSGTDAAGGLIAGAADRTGLSSRWPGTPIREAFSDVLALVRGEGSQPPGIAAIQQEIIAVYGEVDAIATASDVGEASFDAVRERLRDRNPRDASSRMASTAVSLPAPLRRVLSRIPPQLWNVMLAEAREYLDARWRHDVAGECSRAILNRYPVYVEGRDEATVKDFGTFFGPGGTLDRFQTTYLSDFIDTRGRQWKNRRVQGDGLNLSPSFLNALRDAAVVREVFFPKGTPTPSVAFTLTPLYLDPRAARISVDTGSQLISYRHEPGRIFNLVWPDPGGTQQIVLTMTGIDGNSASTQASGPWAWFRMFDRFRLQKTALADQFVLPIEIRGLKATLGLGADSTTNPFELPELYRFRCRTGL